MKLQNLKIKNFRDNKLQAQEGIENIKMNKLEPSPDGLADCKTTIRDGLNNTTLYLHMSIILRISVYNKYIYGYSNYKARIVV